MEQNVQAEKPTEGILRRTASTMHVTLNRIIRDEEGNISAPKCLALGGMVVLVLMVPALMIEVVKFFATCIIVWWLLRTYFKPNELKEVVGEVVA